MHEPLKGPSMPSSPTSARSTKKKITYDQARTKKPETERTRKMRNGSDSPNGGSPSPNNSSRRSRSIAVDKTIQIAKEKVQQQRRSNTSTNDANNSAPASPNNSSRRSRCIDVDKIDKTIQNAKKKSSAATKEQ